MADIMKTQVKIDGIDISTTRLMEWTITESFGQTVRECVIKTTIGIYTDIPELDSGKTISIKRGYTSSTDQFVFDGYIDGIEKDGTTVLIRGKDKMIDLIRKSVTYSYDGASFPSTELKGSDIATDLIETWGGMSAEVVDTGDVLTLAKFICNGTDVFSRLQVLADVYDYQIYYDSDDEKVHFEPKGFTSSSEALYVGGVNANVSDVPKWVFDNSQCVNKLIVKGAVQEVRDTETFSGDAGALQSFTLTKKPISVEAYEDIAGTWTLKVPGVISSTSGDYDYTIDKEAKSIACTTNWDPASAASNVKIEYVNAIPVPIQVEDLTSQEKYGIYQAEKMFSDIQSVEDAENRGNSWVDKYSSPFAQVTVKPVNLIDYDAGTKVDIVDIFNNESRKLVINKVVKKFPHNADTLHLGDKEWKISEWGKFTLERIRRLEEENQKNTDLLIQIKRFPHTVSFRRRYLDARKVQALGDGFILGSIKKGILGTDVLGSPYEDVMIWGNINYGTWGGQNWGSTIDLDGVLVRRVWPNEKYIETFMDEDFKGTGNADWDTTNKQLVFTSA